MRDVSPDPVQALALLPLDPNGASERQWLQNALAWLKSAPPGERDERLRRLAAGIRGKPALANRFQQLWGRAYAPRLFCEAGLPEPTSISRAVIARVKRRLLPQVEDDLDLYAALQSADLREEDAQWIEGLADADVAAWRDLLGRQAMGVPQAIRLLALRSAAISLSRSVMRVMPHRYEAESPFFELVNVAATDTGERLEAIVLRCQATALEAHAAMEQRGVSADLVFRLDLVIAQLDRIHVLLRLIDGREDARAFASMLAGAVAAERGAHGLVRNGVNRVARQVVAHTGKSGEHYIANSQAEWMRMGYGALGAGGITAFTAMFKYLFAATAMAPLWVGVAHSFNYTASFVLMQLLGWSLASKMPSMTAAALCAALESDDGMHAEVKLVAAITRTQVVVTAGNLLGAIPLSVLIDWFIQWKNGNPFLTHEAALHGVESLNPLHSFTIPFAALTGGFLWFSSLVAGWTANWMVVHRLPTAIAQSRRARRSLGERGAVEAADFVKHHASGIAGYVCLGLLLGLLPFVSVFAGIPVEVRHITLASASLSYAVSSLAWAGEVNWGEVTWAVVGLAATGLLNFGVSFALGLWLAVRARNLDTANRRRLLGALWNEFRGHPGRFLWRHD